MENKQKQMLKAKYKGIEIFVTPLKNEDGKYYLSKSESKKIGLNNEFFININDKNFELC